MSSPTPRARRHSDTPDPDPQDRDAGTERGRAGAHRLPRSGAWLTRLAAAVLVLLVAGLVTAWYTGALPIGPHAKTDDSATDVPIRVDPSGSASDDQASRGDREEKGGAASPSPTPTRTEEPEPDRPDENLSAMQQLAAEAIRLTNAERKKAGCGEVKENAKLTAAAQGHSEDMAVHDYFDHTSQDGRSPWDRARAEGYNDAIGENIAAGYPTAKAVIEGWMNSPGHRDNMLNCAAKSIGLGVASHNGGQLYWTQMFGSS